MSGTGAKPAAAVIEQDGRRRIHRPTRAARPHAGRVGVERASAPPPRPLPELHFPPDLPVSARRDEIADAIRANPVVIVAGETGSGKTTQLPKICSMAGRGRAGLIGHTQPRRIAAAAVARRIAEELRTPLGTHVGYKVRFNEQFSRGAAIKLMTDGILLAESLADPLLSAYDTIIVDEAHERSLNIDFLLGYLKRLLQGPRRDNLRVVVTSATIDSQRFAEFFALPKPAPVIEVSGRLYPVEIRWQGFDDTHRDEDDESDLPSRIDEAIESLWRESPGDVLVFLPGEREIRDTAEHLDRLRAKAPAGSVWTRGALEILPLYARLSPAQQQRVFEPGGARRIVLATNVAETSLTVPGIRYVVDSGLARVKRYRYRGKVEQLQIEPISQAAAAQRAGRCGRVSDGVCIRLYDEEDFAGRPRFTDPEILRSSLASVILRMSALNLPDVEQFPFLDPPPRKAVADGFALLQELGAVDASRTLTPVGRSLARLPLDPRIGRMLMAAHRGGCLAEVLVIAAALSSQDPRERPAEARQAADQMHKRHADERSDFMSLLKLWRYWQQAQTEKESNRKLAARLAREFLSARRLREWADVHGQLAEAVRELNWHRGTVEATPKVIHQALLTGLLGQLGFRQGEDPTFTGTHQTRFLVHPSSILARKPPRWLMAAELVDTGRLYARTVAAIEPEWIEQAAGHLIQRQWSDPFWSRKIGQAMLYERGLLYGLTIYAQRRVSAAARDPAGARDMLIREGLVQGEVDEAPPFLAHNLALAASIEQLEQRIRRPDLLVDEDYLVRWYDERIPQDVASLKSLTQWWREASRETPRLLHLDREELLRRDDAHASGDAFPRSLRMSGMNFELAYRFDPGAGDDGVTMTVPVSALNQVDAMRCDWLVPGMLADKIEALLRNLPQRYRRHLVPVPESAQALAVRLEPVAGSRPLLDAMVDALREGYGLTVLREDFRPETLAAHLQMNLHVVDAHGARIDAGRNIARLKAEHGVRAQHAFQQALAQVASQLRGTPAASQAVKASTASKASKAPTAAAIERRAETPIAPLAGLPAPGVPITRWDFGPWPEIIELAQGDDTLIGFPALVDRGDAVELKVFDEEPAARAAHRAGLVRLFSIALREPLRSLERSLPDFDRLALLHAAGTSGGSLRDAIRNAVVERTCMEDPLPVDAEAFATRVAQARPRVGLVGQELGRSLAQVLTEEQAIRRKLQGLRAHAAVVEDVQQQLSGLLPTGFATHLSPERWTHLPRYLAGISMRLDRVRADPQRDEKRMAEMAPLLAGWRRLVAQRRGQDDSRLEEFRWLLEELRISMFAQELRTPFPVSVKRLQKSLEAMRG